ncbi:hypothetical protein CSKR_203055, partial [Clonorchis sinensis]
MTVFQGPVGDALPNLRLANRRRARDGGSQESRGVPRERWGRQQFFRVTHVQNLFLSLFFSPSKVNINFPRCISEQMFIKSVPLLLLGEIAHEWICLVDGIHLLILAGSQENADSEYFQ